MLLLTSHDITASETLVDLDNAHRTIPKPERATYCFYKKKKEE